MAGPFEAIFGRPTALIEREAADRAAMERTQVGAGTAAAALAEQRRQFDEKGQILRAAAAKWRELNADQGPTIGGGLAPGQFGPPDPAQSVPPGPTNQTALNRFILTDEFFRLPEAGIKWEDAKKALEQNPTILEQFTLGPQQQRFETTPGGRPRMIAENENRPQRPFESSVDKAVTERLQKIAEGGDTARTQLQELEALSAPLLRTGEAFPTGTWRGYAASIGLPVGPRQTDIQVVQSILDGLTPLQRRGLPGAASDRDMATFRGRLPDLLRTAEGNREILAFLTAQARASMQAADAASSAFDDRRVDPRDANTAAGRVRFSDVLEQTRSEIRGRRDTAIEETLGVNVGRIREMTLPELQNYTRELDAAFGRGRIPASIQSRIRERMQRIQSNTSD